MKNILSAIGSFCKKYKWAFLMGAFINLLWQVYTRCLLPIKTPIFWIVVVFACALLCKIAHAYAQTEKNKFTYQGYYMTFGIIGTVLVIKYFASQYFL